jgi:hypothetical protein
MKVEYVKERPVVPVSKFTEGLIEAAFENKDERWSYEEEYRLIRPLQIALKTVGSDKRGFPICLFQVPAVAVKEIILGLESSEELKRQVMVWRKLHPHVQIFIARVSEKNYSLEKHPYTP